MTDVAASALDRWSFNGALGETRITKVNGKDYYISSKLPLTPNARFYKCEHCPEWHTLPFSKKEYEDLRETLLGKKPSVRSPRRKPTPHGAATA